MGKKRLTNECTMLILGFGDCALKHHFMVALVKLTYILGSDFLEQWEADVNYKTRQLILCVND